MGPWKYVNLNDANLGACIFILSDLVYCNLLQTILNSASI